MSDDSEDDEPAQKRMVKLWNGIGFRDVASSTENATPAVVREIMSKDNSAVKLIQIRANHSYRFSHPDVTAVLSLLASPAFTALEKVELHSFDVIKLHVDARNRILNTFFENPNLRCLKFTNCDMYVGAEVLRDLLYGGRILRELEFKNVRFGPDSAQRFSAPAPNYYWLEGPPAAFVRPITQQDWQIKRLVMYGVFFTAEIESLFTEYVSEISDECEIEIGALTSLVRHRLADEDLFRAIGKKARSVKLLRKCREEHAQAIVEEGLHSLKTLHVELGQLVASPPICECLATNVPFMALQRLTLEFQHYLPKIQDRQSLWYSLERNSNVQVTLICSGRVFPADERERIEKLNQRNRDFGKYAERLDVNLVPKAVTALDGFPTASFQLLRASLPNHLSSLNEDSSKSPPSKRRKA